MGMPALCPICKNDLMRHGNGRSIIFMRLSQGSKMASYIWAYLNNYLSRMSVSWRDLMKACCNNASSFMDWIDCKKTWNDALRDLWRFLNLPISRFIVIPQPDRLDFYLPAICPYCRNYINHAIIVKNPLRPGLGVF